MSGRKNVLFPHQIITSGDMNGSLTSLVTNIQNLDNVGMQFNFTGTPTGTFAVQVSADYNFNTLAGNWISLALSPSPAAAGSASNVYVDLNQLSAPWIRSTYTSTATGAQTISPVADVAKSLASKYFKLRSQSGNKYLIWFKVSGTGSAPVLAGYTAEEVDISTGDTAAAVGAAMATVIAGLNSSGDFSASGTTTVTVTNLTTGGFTPAVDVNSGFAFAVTAGAGTLNSYVTAKML